MKGKTKMNRRTFIQNIAVVAAGTAALSTNALSYDRILGANDRISLGHIGIGSRGSELDGMVAALKEKKNVEMTAVCDLWSHNREQAVATNQKYYGKTPRAFQHPEELIACEGSLCHHYFHPGTLPFIVAQTGGRRGKRCLLRKAHGKCS